MKIFVRRRMRRAVVPAGADLVVLNGDPLADLQNLSHAHRVIKGGVIYDPVELMKAVRQ